MALNHPCSAMRTQRKTLVILFDSFLYRIRQEIPDNRAEAMREYIMLINQLVRPFPSQNGWMRASTNETPNAHQNRKLNVVQYGQSPIHKLDNPCFRLNTMADGPLRSIDNAHRARAKKLPIGNMIWVAGHHFIKYQLVSPQ